MGRLNFFLVGTFVGSIQILGYIYESELIKQELREEVAITKRMKNFVSPCIKHCFRQWNKCLNLEKEIRKSNLKGEDF